MNEATNVGGKEKGAASVENQIARILVRVMWAQAWSEANPEADAEARKAAWSEARSAEMDKNLKSFRRGLNALKRAGVTMDLSEELLARRSSATEDAE